MACDDITIVNDLADFILKCFEYRKYKDSHLETKRTFDLSTI